MNEAALRLDPTGGKGKDGDGSRQILLRTSGHNLWCRPQRRRGASAGEQEGEGKARTHRSTIFLPFLSLTSFQVLSQMECSGVHLGIDLPMMMIIIQNTLIATKNWQTRIFNFRPKNETLSATFLPGHASSLKGDGRAIKQVIFWQHLFLFKAKNRY